jgi:long-chain acyl-CoA synthetase
MLFFRIIGRGLRFVLDRLVKIFIRVEVVGLENIKNIDGAVVFMPNHQSYVDSILLNSALPSKFTNKISYAAAQDFLYTEYWFFAWLGELFFNSFPFPRNEGDNINDGLLRMGKMLDLGFSVVVFPEGSVSKTAEILPLKLGAGLIASEMHVDIIPVKLEDVQNLIPYDKFFPRHLGKITVRFGKPIKFDIGDSYSDATAKIERALKAL